MRGRKPKPTVLKLIQGERRTARLNRNEARVPPASPDAPAHLTGLALEKWRELAPQLTRAGILTELDRDALAAYCVQWATATGAQEKIDRVGEVILGYRKQPVLNPYLRARDRALEMMRRFGEQLGLSPSARARIPAEPPREHDPADQYLEPSTSRFSDRR